MSGAAQQHVLLGNNNRVEYNNNGQLAALSNLNNYDAVGAICQVPEGRTWALTKATLIDDNHKSNVNRRQSSGVRLCV